MRKEGPLRPQYVLLTHDFKPMQGGVAEYLHSLWNEVAKTNDAVVLSSTGDLGMDVQHRYRYQKLPRPPSDDPIRFASLPVLWRVHERVRAALLHGYASRVAVVVKGYCEVHGRCFVGAWSGELSHLWCQALRNAGIPYSLFAYGLEFATAKEGERLNWLRDDFGAAKRIYACSAATAKLVASTVRTVAPISVVTPGVPSGPNDATTTTGPRAEWRLSDRRVVLSVCRLVPRKGIDFTIKAVAKLLSEFPDLYYVIAGDGPARSSLQKLAVSLRIQDSVKFLGEVTEAQKQALYDACELFVMPNRLMSGADWEGFGIVFLEAAVAGKPSIGGENGGVPDAIVQGVTGILVDTDTDEMPTLGAMRTLLRDDELRQRMGQAARQRATSQFSWQSIGEQFLEAVQSDVVANLNIIQESR
jgi:phosphatidylinositol alpha-1,6-mannosyltransferase